MRTLTVSEGASLPVEIRLTDDAGNPIFPASVTWSLFSLRGDTINGRNEVPVTPLAPVMRIVLTPSDTLVPEGFSEAERALIVEGTYSNPDFGSLIFREEIRIKVRSLSENIISV